VAAPLSLGQLVSEEANSATFGFLQGRSDYEPEPLDRLDYVELGFKPSSRDRTTWRSAGICEASCPNPCPTEVIDIPGYTGRMAKVMVSLPDDLLAEVDAEARRGGTTRSAVMRDFADAALRRRRENRAAAMRSLLSDTSPHGGRAAEQVKATRPGQ
jgi:hypothetical protein